MITHLVTSSALWVYRRIIVDEPGIIRFTKISLFAVTPVNVAALPFQPRMSLA